MNVNILENSTWPLSVMLMALADSRCVTISVCECTDSCDCDCALAPSFSVPNWRLHCHGNATEAQADAH